MRQIGRSSGQILSTYPSQNQPVRPEISNLVSIISIISLQDHLIQKLKLIDTFIVHYNLLGRGAMTKMVGPVSTRVARSDSKKSSLGKEF